MKEIYKELIMSCEDSDGKLIDMVNVDYYHKTREYSVFSENMWYELIGREEFDRMNSKFCDRWCITVVATVNEEGKVEKFTVEGNQWLYHMDKPSWEIREDRLNTDLLAILAEVIEERIAKGE